MMKNFTLCLMVFGMIVFSFTQSSHAQTSLKGSGEVFYSNTFDWENPDDPRGWTPEDGFYFEDPDDIGYNWHWYPNDSLVAQWSNDPPFGSSTPEDGHLGLFLNRYNDWLDPMLNVNNGVVFPTLDCSEHTSVIVRYETNFMCYSTSSGMEMMISNDAGVHWATYNVGFGCGHKDRPNDISPGGSAIFEANVSDVAAGMPEVIIKFHWSGTNDYWWLIDDFELVEAWDNDLRMKHYVLEWDDGDEGTEASYIHNIPISQIGGAYTNFEAGVINFGEFDQYGVHLDVDISRNNQSVWNNTTEPEWLPTLLLDTAIVEESFSPPAEYGHYKITYDLKQEETEQSPENDRAEVYFNVTDSIYSHCDDTSEETFVWGFEAYGAEGEPNEQHFVGSRFPIYGDCEINSVSAYVAGGMADGEIEFRMAIYWVPPAEEEDQTPVEWLFSEIVTLDSSMHNTWVTLPLEKDGESEFLFAGDYIYAGVEYWNWHTEVRPYKRYENFKIGSDVGVKLHDPVSVVRSGVETSFGSGIAGKRKLMIRLNLNDNSNIIDGIDMSGNLSNLEQNYPNPVVNSTDIAYELASPAEVEIEITDMTGRTVLIINEGNRIAGKHNVIVNTESLESGVYFYTLKAGKFVDTKRMVVSK